MNKKWVLIGLMAGVALSGATFIVQAADQPVATAAAPTDQQLIASAMAAAPLAVSKAAAVVAMTADGNMRTLREGTNAFTCMADTPETPGPDPMCWDKSSDGWMQAYLHHGTPPAGKVGLMYMLAGGTDSSNTDPYAAAPTANNHWIQTGPHIMIVGADAAFYDQYPKNADPDTSTPYVMWAGTPLQHLMAPVK